MIIRIKKTYIKAFLSLVLVATIGTGIYSIKMADAQKQKLFSNTEKVKLSQNYYEYSDETFEMTKSRGKTILFFAATDWCNTCSALDEELKEKSTTLPEGLTVLKTDYDNNKDLNKKYFVTLQHTLILLDRNGDEITRWVGGGFDTLLTKVI